MDKIIAEYKKLKSQQSGEVGNEQSTHEANWNDAISEKMNELLKRVTDDVSKRIRLNHL